MALQFDKKGLAKELLKHLEEEIKETLMIDWEQNVIKYMRYSEFQIKADFEVETKIVQNEADMVVAYLRTNTYVLADSYGTGSLMLSGNPGYEAYRRSDAWNPMRTDKTIVGRPKKYNNNEKYDYIDIFGKGHTTSGRMAGKPLEGVEVRAGFKIEPVAPSYALQIAEQWLYKTYLPNAYKLAIQKTNFAKYLKEIN